ncbi:MAG: polysaccharide deacetylase family protein [Chitinophagaceae bacterium]|nr:polysaccharide deacetylase family protein [Chitinophagaceae bacterium]
MVIRNFLFHRVSDEKDAMWSPMTVSLFSRIIRILTKKFLVVPFEAYQDDPGAFSSGKKIATVMFDDGYKDNIEFAAPVLAQFKCPASFYIVTDCVDKNIPTWTYLVDNALSKTRKNSIELSYDFVPENFKTIELKNLSGKEKEIKPWLKKLSNQHRLLIMRSLLEQCNDVETPRKMMNWNDVRELGNNGFIIGSHSHTHPMLASLQNEDEISEELKISSQRIQQETGKLPATISYPIGSYDSRVVVLSKKEGYKYGLAVKQKFYNTNKDDIFEVPRVELYEEPSWKVNMRINGMYSFVKKIWP